MATSPYMGEILSKRYQKTYLVVELQDTFKELARVIDLIAPNPHAWEETEIGLYPIEMNLLIRKNYTGIRRSTNNILWLKPITLGP